MQDYKMRCRGGGKKISAGRKTKQHRVAVLLSMLKSASFIASMQGRTVFARKPYAATLLVGLLGEGAFVFRIFFIYQL